MFYISQVLYSSSIYVSRSGLSVKERTRDSVRLHSIHAEQTWTHLITLWYFVCFPHSACSPIGQWTFENPSSWRSCWLGNSWNIPLKKRSPSRLYACGWRSVWNAYERFVSRDRAHGLALHQHIHSQGLVYGSSTHSAFTHWTCVCMCVFAEAAAVV